MASQNKSAKIHDVIRVSPSTKSSTEFTLPLTLFDMLWFNVPRDSCVFLYQLTELTIESFNSEILPNLKHSLSLTLSYYLPLAGKIKWTPDATKPAIYCSPDDTVSLTVAESEADFNSLSSNDEIHHASDFRVLVPKLFVSEDEGELLAIQITLFPNQGFSIGFSSDHAIVDANCTAMFMKSWTYISQMLIKQQDTSLPSELTPLFDRSLINDPADTAMFLANFGLQFNQNSKALRLWPSDEEQQQFFKGTFLLTREDINELRDKISSHKNESSEEQLRLSNFVVIFAYVSICLIKARGGDSDREIHFGFAADYRHRLDPPVPKNYIGNCVASHIMLAKASDFMAENGILVAAETISGGIKELESTGVDEQIKKTLNKFISLISKPQGQAQGVGVSWSPKLDVYCLDFGYGRPKKFEIVSIDRGGSISLVSAKDYEGGVEVGVVLSEPEMEAFRSQFNNGLKGL